MTLVVVVVRERIRSTNPTKRRKREKTSGWALLNELFGNRMAE